MHEINPEEITKTMAPLLEVLEKIGAAEWHEWLRDAVERARGDKGPAIEWVDLLWFAQLNYLPLLHFAHQHKIPAAQIKEFNECYEQFLSTLDPGSPVEICGFIKIGDRNDQTKVFGPLALAEQVATESLQFANVFCAMITSGKIRQSYEQLSEEFRKNRSLTAYVNIFERAAAKYKGYPVAYQIQNISIIYSGSHAFGEFGPKWPKYVRPDQRRALINVFWQTISGQDFGCHSTLWLTANRGAYSLSQIEFYTP